MVSRSSGWSEWMVSAEGYVKRNERMVFFGEGARVTLVTELSKFTPVSGIAVLLIASVDCGWVAVN